MDGGRGDHLLPSPVDPPANPWDGFYVGGHAGYGWANRFGCFGGSFPASHTCSPPQFNYNQTGWLAGGQTGYNMVMGSGPLLGVEVSASLTGITGNLNTIGNSFDGVGDWKYLGTATARLGWGNDKFLVYAEGGLGLGGFEYNSASCNFESNHQGWVYGGGVEAMVSGTTVSSSNTITSTSRAKTHLAAARAARPRSIRSRRWTS